MNKNYRFMPKGKKQNNQFSSVTPSSIVEFQEPKEEKINLIRQSQIPSNNINEEFYNSDLNHLKQVEIVNGKETESDDVIINNQLHENIVDQTDSSRMKYLISQNEIENIDFISTLIRLKGRNNTQTSDRLSIENNVIVKPEDESKSYIKEILDICDNNNNINCNSNGESFSISVNDNTNGTNVMLYRQSANSAQPKTIKGINTKDLIEITNRRKMMKDSMTSVDPYLRRRHLEEVARMEKIKKDLDKKELGSCAFTPQINKRSKLICEKMSSGKYETIDDVPQNNIYSNRASVQNNYTKDIQQLIQEAKDIDNNDTFKHYLTTNKKVNNTKYSNISNQPITTKSTRYDNYNSNGSNVNVNVAPIENLSNIINVSSSGVIPSNYYNNNDEEEFPIETAEQYDYNNNEQNNIPIENRLFYSTEDLEREAQQQQSKPKIKLNLKQIKEEAKRRQQLLEQYQTVIDPNDPNSNISITNSTTLPPKTSSVNTQANTSGNIAMTSPSNQIVTSSSNTRQFYPQGNIKLEINNRFIFPNNQSGTIRPNIVDNSNRISTKNYDNASSMNDFVNYGSNNPVIVNTANMNQNNNDHFEDLSSIIHLSPDMVDKNDFQVQDIPNDFEPNQTNGNKFSVESSVNDTNIRKSKSTMNNYESSEGDSQNENDIVTNQRQNESKEIKFSQIKGNNNTSNNPPNNLSINLSKLTNFVDYNSNTSASGNNNLSNNPSKKIFTPKSNYYGNIISQDKNKSIAQIPKPNSTFSNVNSSKSSVPISSRTLPNNTGNNNVNIINIKISDSNRNVESVKDDTQSEKMVINTNKLEENQEMMLNPMPSKHIIENEEVLLNDITGQNKVVDSKQELKEEKREIPISDLIIESKPQQESKDVKIAEINLFDDDESEEEEENHNKEVDTKSNDKVSVNTNKSATTSEYERKMNFFNDSESMISNKKERNSTIAHLVNSVEPIEESKIEIDIDDLVTPKYIFNNNETDNDINITPTKSNMRKHLSRSFCGTSHKKETNTTIERSSKGSFIGSSSKQTAKTKKLITNPVRKHSKSKSTNNKIQTSNNLISNSAKKKYEFKPKKIKPKTNDNINVNKVTVNISNKSEQRSSATNTQRSNVSFDNYFKNIFKQSNNNSNNTSKINTTTINNGNNKSQLSSILNTSDNIAQNILNNKLKTESNDISKKNDRNTIEYNMDKFSIEVQNTSPTKKSINTLPNDLITDSLRIQRESQEKSRKKISENLDKIRRSQEKNEIEIKKEIKNLNMNENDFAQSNSSLALKLETDKELNASLK